MQQGCINMRAWSKQIRTSAPKEAKGRMTQVARVGIWLWLSPPLKAEKTVAGWIRSFFIIFFLKVWAIQMWWLLFSGGTECHVWKPVQLSFMISWKHAGKTKQKKGRPLITYRAYLMISTQQQKGNINSSHRKKHFFPIDMDHWHRLLLGQTAVTNYFEFGHLNHVRKLERWRKE